MATVAVPTALSVVGPWGRIAGVIQRAGVRRLGAVPVRVPVRRRCDDPTVLLPSTSQPSASQEWVSGGRRVGAGWMVVRRSRLARDGDRRARMLPASLAVR